MQELAQLIENQGNLVLYHISRMKQSFSRIWTKGENRTNFSAKGTIECKKYIENDGKSLAVTDRHKPRWPRKEHKKGKTYCSRQSRDQSSMSVLSTTSSLGEKVVKHHTTTEKEMSPKTTCTTVVRQCQQVQATV